MKKITLLIFLTAISVISFTQSRCDLVYNNQMSEISAVSSMGMIDDQISMSSDPVLSLDINNNGILDYVVAKHALGEVYILLDYMDFNNATYTPQTASDVVIINGALNLGVSFDKGDFNNDGIDDIILGASLSNIDGEAFIIFGSSNFLSFGTHNIINAANIHIEFSGFSGNADRFGDQVKFADLNNDNYDDAIISAPVAWYEGQGSGRGSVYVIYGSSNAPAAIQARTNSNVIIEGSGTFDHIGKYLGVGDFDNDGIFDLSFTSPHWPGAGQGGQRGKAWILYGGNSLLSFYDASLTYNNLSSFEGHAQNDEMAYVSSGDFNGDNITDLIVSAGKYDTSVPNSGVVYVLYGPINRGQYLSDIETFSNITQIYPSTPSVFMYIDANFGQSVSLFDVNNDGIDDMIIGMVGYSRSPSTGTQTNEGGAIIIYGTSSMPNTIYADGGEILFLAEPATCAGCPYNISFGRSVGLIETNDNKIVATIADNERNRIYLFNIDFGCTDSLALNYNASASINDSSCLYACVTSYPYYEDFDSGPPSVSLQSGYAAISTIDNVNNTTKSWHGYGNTAGLNVNWSGTQATGPSAFSTYPDYIATMGICIDLTAYTTNQVTLSFDLRQDYDGFSNNNSWFRLVDQSGNLLLSNCMQPSTSCNDPWLNLSCNLSAYTGSSTTLFFQSCNKYANYGCGDNAYVDNINISILPIPPSWDCDNQGNCYDPGTGTGQYSSLTACQSNCIQTTVNVEGVRSLMIYPNPTDQILNICFSTIVKQQNIKIQLINTIGEIVFLENLQNYSGDYFKKINLEIYSKGIYFLEITTNGGIINKKLSLQ